MRGGCPRWPESLRLLNESTGKLFRGRCRATNQCSYCAKMAAIETAEMLALDALEHGAPEVWAVLGTRSIERRPEPFYNARRLVLRGLRRRWPGVQVSTLVEFTTGYGAGAGGRRRPHWNLLIKGVRREDLDEVRDVAVRIWCEHVDAEPVAQHVGLVSEVGGLMRYLALHFQKESQAPPKGWRGHRFTSTRGYFPLGAAAARDRARESIAFKRRMHGLLADTPAQAVLTAQEIDDLCDELVAKDALVPWSLKQVEKLTADPLVAKKRAALAPIRNPRRAR